MGQKPRSTLRARQARTAYTFLSVILLYFALFLYYPIVRMVHLTFLDASGLNVPRFAGLKNYRTFFADKVALLSIWRSFQYVLYWAFPVLLSGFAIALLLNREMRLRSLFRAMYFLPVITSMIAVSMVWKWLYHPSYGLFNFVLESLGLPRQMFLRSGALVLPSIALMGVWKTMGFYAVIFLAGLQGIPRVYYEAAEIDGAGARRKLVSVTLPLLRHTLAFSLVMAVIQGFQVFDSVYVMTHGEAEDNPGGPYYASTVSVLYLVQQAFRTFRYSYGATIALMLFLVLMVFVLVQFRLYRYESDY